MKTLSYTMIAAAALLVFGLSANGAVAGAWGYEKLIPIAQKAQVTIGVRSTNVIVKTWDRPEVKIESEEDLGDLITVAGDEILIGGTAAGKIAMPSEVDQLSLSLPASAQVTISAVSGDVVVEGLAERVKITTVSGDLAVRKCKGPGTLKTVSGNVQVADFQGDLSIKTVSGDLLGAVVQAGLVELKTVSGDIVLTSLKARELRLSTVSGDARIEGAFEAGGSAHATTMSGDVQLKLPADAAFEIAAKTRSGSVRTDFEVKSAEKGDSVLSGKVGAGGTDLNLTSFSGDLKILKAK